MTPVAVQESAASKAARQAYDTTNLAAETAGRLTEKVKATTHVVAEQPSSIFSFAFDIARSVVEIAANITQKGVNTVKSAACLGTGSFVESAKFGIGATAISLDLAGSIINRCFEIIHSIQEKGHDVTKKTVWTIQDTLNELTIRGEDVIHRSVQTTTQAVSQGFDKSQEIASQVKDVSAKAADTVKETTEGTLHQAKEVFGSAAHAVQAKTQDTFEKGRQVAQHAKQTANSSRKTGNGDFDTFNRGDGTGTFMRENGTPDDVISDTIAHFKKGEQEEAIRQKNK